MAWIEFNGIRSSDVGVIIESMPAFGKPARRFSSETIPGVDGSLFTVEDAWENIESSVVINSFGHDPTVVYNWLDGIGYLRTSDNPDKVRKVRCLKAQTQKRLRFAEAYDSITVPLIADPYCTDAVSAPIQASNPMIITGQGDIDAQPVITITGSGDVDFMIGRSTMLIDFGSTEKTVVIDCPAKFATVNGASAFTAGVNITLITEDDSDRWPVLTHDGTNTVSWSGTVTSASIVPNWRYFC